MKLPDITLPDGSMLIDRVLVERVLTTKGTRNAKGKQVETVERRTYGYVVSTYRPPGILDERDRREQSSNDYDGQLSCRGETRPADAPYP